MTQQEGASISAQQPAVGLPKRLLSAAEAAEMLNISLRTVRRLIANKKLPIVRIGRVVRIRPEGLAALIGEE